MNQYVLKFTFLGKSHQANVKAKNEIEARGKFWEALKSQVKIEEVKKKPEMSEAEFGDLLNRIFGK